MKNKMLFNDLNNLKKEFEGEDIREQYINNCIKTKIVTFILAYIHSKSQFQPLKMNMKYFLCLNELSCLIFDLILSSLIFVNLTSKQQLFNINFEARHLHINMKRNSSESDKYQSGSDSQSQSADLIHLAPEIDSEPVQQTNPRHHPDTHLNNNQQENRMRQIVLPNPLINRLTIPTQNRPRLIIDKMVLQNFKSYADTQVIGPFHQNFTSVVGPNGSGKSNLIESMLFIFGYKANWMRLNRLNQLIHNSSTMGSIQKASVEVHFKKIIQSEDGKITEIPSGEFSIKRTVKTSGTSKYCINRQQSTQAEVKDRLKQQGIDLNNNRFLILQGEVQQISQMKQKSGDREKPGLLQYLQDIIGSNVYIDQIQASVIQYNSIEQTKHEKGELMKLAEIELKNMNKGKQQAIKYVKKQRQIYQIHNILQQVIISNNKYDAKQFAQKLTKVEAEKDRIISEEKQKLKKQAERIRDIKRNKNQIQAIEKELAKDEEVMSKMVSADKNINQQISFKSEDLVKYNRKNNELDAQLAKIISESDQVKVSLPVNKQKLAKLKVQLDEMEQELQKHDRPELKQKMKGLETDLKKVQHQIKTFQQKQRTMKKNFQVKYKKSENNELKQIELQRKFNEEKETLQKIIQAEVQALKIKESFSKQLEQLTNTRKQVAAQLQKVSSGLRQQVNQTREIGMFNDMFEKIMQQNIPGVVGRLGDLGTVPKMYDEIITSCCSRLDNIVVKNMEAANAVLNFLKTSKLGRVTCIILDKIQEQRKYMERNWSNLPNSTRLFDVIQPVSQEVKLAFYFAISDTIYCENSQLGMEYSLKDDRNRRRVISKKPGGYIIYELNGLMNGCLPRSGGFTVKAKTKMRLNNDSNEIKELQKLKIEYTQKINKIQQRYRAVKGEYESVQKDIDQFKVQKRKIESNLFQTKQQLGQIQKNSSKNNKNYEEQKSRLQKQINSIGSHIQDLEKSKKQITTEVNQIEKQQRSQQNEKITRLRDSYKISKQQYQLLDKDIQKKVAILETTLKRVEENKKNKQDFTKKVEMLDKQIKKLQKQRDDVEVKATQTFKKIQANNQKIQKCKKVEQQLKVLFEQQQKEVRESKIKIQKARQQVQICKQKIQTYHQAIRHAQSQLKKQRETYRQLSATYDFIEDIDSIEFMNVEEVKKNIDQHNKSDTSVILNQSIDISNTSMTKVFPLQRLLQISPFDDIPEEKLDQFLLFTDKMKTMLVAENQNLKKMSGNNLQIISQFRSKFSDFKKKHQEFQAVRQSQLSLKKKIQQLKEKRLQSFRQGFSIINSKLKQVYQLLTRGGDAELELIDSLDPFSDGINFSVRPPKKAWKQINKLSGGEKTLSSLSLIFALHYYKPTPLYFMDEIDAALDFKNVSIVADYIKKRTKDAQFIIISLRNNMFELADKLVGVYKTYDKTKIIHFIPSKMRKSPNGVVEKQNLDYNQN